MKAIEVSSKKSGAKINVNINAIAMVGEVPEEMGGGGTIGVEGGTEDGAWWVKETLAEILALIENETSEMKFIGVTFGGSNAKALINVEKIVYVEPADGAHGSGGGINLKGMKSFSSIWVKETLTEIMTLIKKTEPVIH